MALELEQREIHRRFGNAKCRVHYQNQKETVCTTLDKVNWKECLSLTVLFDEPKFYIIDGDVCKRDGVRIIPLMDKKHEKVSGN